MVRLDTARRPDASHTHPRLRFLPDPYTPSATAPPATLLRISMHRMVVRTPRPLPSGDVRACLRLGNGDDVVLAAQVTRRRFSPTAWGHWFEAELEYRPTDSRCA